MYIEIIKLRIYPAAIIITSMIGSFMSPVYAAEKPHKQEFVVTAYYSPEPGQCCYFRGSYEEEVMFNGQGKAGADGTPVYPGMIAAPQTYAFGTVIDLPGIGVGTVHDRGSRIVEWGEDIHRIDLWVGSGEEGLARALAWGTRKVTGTVYPADGGDVPAESFSLDYFADNPAVLAGLPKSDPVIILAQARFGDQSYASRLLQQMLKNNGVPDQPVTGQFGPVTRDSLKKFLEQYGLPGDGTGVTSEAAAVLVSAAAIKPKNLPDLMVGLGPGARGQDVRQVQKLLRYLGYYRGRTDGVYDQNLKESVTQFQLQSSVIRQALESGAGRVGPATQAAILKAWKVKQVASKSRNLLVKTQVASKVKTTLVPSKVLSIGDHGTQVKVLQQLLQKMGYLDASDLTANFGKKTERAIIAYQKDRKVITSERQHGAGIFGPATRKTLLQDVVDAKLREMKYKGT